ncbi:Ergosterol biosynthetic protein 28 [Linum grandiflorum]
MEALGWWLMLVGSLRLASVWFGFFNIPRLRSGVYGKAPMTAVHGRTFAIWTLVTCTLCYTCAFNLDNKPLYLVTLLSFIYALLHFMSETLIYQSMSIANLTTVSVFAGKIVAFYMLWF